MLTSVEDGDENFDFVEQTMSVLYQAHHDEGDFIRCIIELLSDVKEPLDATTEEGIYSSLITASLITTSLLFNSLIFSTLRL